MRRVDNVVFAYITFRVHSIGVLTQHGLVCTAQARERITDALKRAVGGAWAKWCTHLGDRN